MKYPHFQAVILFFSFAMLVAACGNDDPAREAAAAKALEAAKAQQATEQPTPPPAADPKNERPKTGGTLNLAVTGGDAQKGKEACVAITARSFKSIVSMQYSLKWDANVLKFKQLKGFGLPGLSADNFGTQATGKGVLTHSWFDASVKGVNKADGETLYEICFEATGAAGSKSAVQIVDSPIIIEIANSNSEFLSLDATPGTVLVK
ncbi:MAG: hypothetical protein MUC59_07435 [Saprospiraceae bacterium]|nr:hypothetical protein [Saprospiraceae bacterium]